MPSKRPGKFGPLEGFGMSIKAKTCFRAEIVEEFTGDNQAFTSSIFRNKA